MILAIDCWIVSNSDLKPIRESFMDDFKSHFLGVLKESVVTFLDLRATI